MTTEQLQKRRRVMRRSAALGHCICDAQQPCPCDLFKAKEICHCAGEQAPLNDGPVRLTAHVRSAGCASKISKGVLEQVLRGLPASDDPRVIVGSSAGDDAGVIMLSEQTATILTVDVFCPAVDDPYTFGAIAAANSLSDIYAMGGTPQAALSIIGYPVHLLPADAMREILRGGLDKMREAGVAVVGGHSLNDAEPKCGFAVLGTSPAGAFVRNAGAQVGDRLVLTKPLGSGIAVFAQQVGRASADLVQRASRSMASLNQSAGQWMVRLGAHAATDVTGFSLLGHLCEIVRNSGVEATVEFDRIPLLDEIAELARQDVLGGAVERNRESVDAAMLQMDGLSAAQQAILFSPETSGGLLVFLAPGPAEEYVRRLREEGIADATIIGSVTRRLNGGTIRVTTERAEEFGPLALGPLPHAESADRAPQPADCCCADAQTTISSVGAAPGAAAPVAVAATSTVAPLPRSASADAFGAYMGKVNAAGALSVKHKKLIGVALAVSSRCEECVVRNARAAREAGASEQEIAEAASLGIAFGGAPAAMFYESVRNRT